MLHHPTLDKLQQLKFTGMLRALQEQASIPDMAAIPFEERLGLLVDRELTERSNRRMQVRLRAAKLKQNTAIEDIDFKSPRGLDRSLILKLADCDWVAAHLNVLITGPTGVGKTWLACALAHRHAVKGIARSMPESRAYCRSWMWVGRTGGTPRSSGNWAKPRYWCWMIGGWQH